uniref:Uncharacterized protein n=1 Tax=Timema shepardi TaxID=629360 RepID=A0A7R9G5J8_TIMSH|nr:unnamed protein product [Timema shepardi]
MELPVGIRMLSVFDTCGIVLPKAVPASPGRVSLRKIRLPHCHFDLAKFPKATTPNFVYEMTFNELSSTHFHAFKRINTDGSKFGDSNKLRSIGDGVSWWPSSIRKSRRKAVIVTRLLVGHTSLTHGFLVRGDPLPVCESYDAPLSMNTQLIPQMILGNTLQVDTFFVISGLLVSYVFFNKLKDGTISSFRVLPYYIHRYCR